MSKNSTSKSESIIALLGIIVIGLIVAVCILLVENPRTPADLVYPRESNIMAIENQRDYGVYGLYGLPGERMGEYVDPYTAAPAPACTPR